LRSDTFAGILDDSPTLRGIVSSSTLHAMQHINNFLLRDKLGDKWTMAVSEEGLKSKGFMTVIAARATRDAGNVPHVCKMQVSAEAFMQAGMLGSRHYIITGTAQYTFFAAYNAALKPTAE